MNFHRRNTNLSPILLNLSYELIERRYRNRIYRPGTLSLTRTGQTAIDARVFVVTCPDNPILEWTALDLFILRSKNILVKRLYRYWFISIDIDMNNTCHLFIVSKIFEL